jgi:hypothetical protein
VPPPGYPAGWTAPIAPTYYAAPNDPLVSADFSGWWNRSFALVKAAWRPLAVVQLAGAVPMVAVLIVVDFLTRGESDRLATTDKLDGKTAIALILVILPSLLLSWLFGVLIQLISTHLLVQKVTTGQISIGAALRASLKRAFPLMGWSLLGGIIVAVGLVFCILPGFYATAALSVLPVIVLLERRFAVGRSFQLFNANLGASLGRILTIAGLVIGFGIVSAGLTSVFPIGGDSPVELILTEVISGLFAAVSGVVFTPMYLTAYADMRARHEPFSTAYLTA